MSRKSLARLPDHISSLITLYEKAVSKFNLYSHKDVLQYLEKSSGEYERFQNYKLRTNSFNNHDFPPLIGKSIQPLFEKPLKLSHGEEKTTEELFKKEYVPQVTSKSRLDSLHTSYHRTAKHTTDYAAKIITSFASYYDPVRSVPRIESFKTSYRWYQKLFEHTPVVLILRQKNRLFSESSLMQLNRPYSTLKKEIDRLGNGMYKSEEIDGHRSYHLTDLASIDLFTLAFNHSEGKDRSRVEEILFANNIDIIEPYQGTSVPQTELIQYFEKHPISNTIKALEKEDIRDSHDVHDIIPFDLTYSSHYILTVESPVINHNHTPLLELINNSELEIVAARIGFQHPELSQFFTELAQQAEAKASGKILNYSQLLAVAAANSNKSPIHTFMKGLGASGLLEVEESSKSICLCK